MKIYIASRLENAALVRELRDALVALGHEITYDWTVHGSVRSEVYSDKTKRQIEEVALLELRGVLDADAVVFILPGGRGMHFEMGAAVARLDIMKNGPLVIAWSEGADLFGVTEATSCFYHLPHVVRARADEGIRTMDDLALLVHAASPRRAA